MKKLLFYIVLVLAAAGVWLGSRPAQVAANDGIPDNCEYTRGAYYQPNVFARYEPQNSRLVLVDWSSGEVVKVVAEGLAQTRILGWSVDCRYLAGAVGQAESMDTVIWDVTTATMIGKVPDAHLKPHPITWGPDDYLMVETRDGAVLWNVPANTQIHLDTGFNTTTSRNFSRLRWDAAHYQVTANLAVGGRVVYDLTNGQVMPAAANVSMSLPQKADKTITLDGKQYDCVDGYSYGYRNWFRVEGASVPFVEARYNVRDKDIKMILLNQQFPYETLAVLEDHVDISTFDFRGWSPDCHYIVASVGHPKSTTTDTVVWDVTTNKRVGAFTDAHLIEHPIHWSSDGKLLLVETRDGAYIWHMATDARVLVNAHVETALAGTSGVRSFFEVGWDEDKKQLLGVAIEKQDVVSVYDVDNGQVVGSYPLSILDKPQDKYVPQPDAPAPTPLPNVPLDGVNGMSEDQYSMRLYQGNYLPFQRCGEVEARYDGSTRQFVLANLSTHIITRTLEADSNPVYAVHWSKGCRYIYAAVSEQPLNSNTPFDSASIDDLYVNELSYTVTFWDAQSGQRLMAFPRPYKLESPAGVVWSPAGERVLVRTTEGYFLCELATGKTVLLTYAPHSDAINALFAVYWDYSRGQVLISGGGSAIAFDMRTGAERYFLSAGSWRSNCDYYGCGFSVSDDNRMLLMTTYSGVSIWNLDTLQHNFIDIVVWYEYLHKHGAFSPDGRYFVTGFTAIRVWDLQTPSDKPQAPTAIYKTPKAAIETIKFVDNTTIETTDEHGKIQQWDILSGKVVG